jgi:hypothetical protein
MTSGNRDILLGALYNFDDTDDHTNNKAHSREKLQPNSYLAGGSGSICNFLGGGGSFFCYCISLSCDGY